MIVLVAVFALTVTAETAVLGITVAKSGKAVTAVKAVVETTLATTESSAWVNIPGMSTTIKVPANQKALLIITFSAEVTCEHEGTGQGGCLVRVLVDGLPSTPGQVIFDGTRDSLQDGVNNLQAQAETNSMQFVAGPLTSGEHSVQVQFITDTIPGDDVNFGMQERTLTVLRSKV